ncbi:hypothetical protein RAE19_18445 [Rhodoferax sp. TBRC 17660]|uniref:Uncharacterized protein n=1 Tax=Rhodoferax potami TaxID=3068338 RepID=A0ABU3KS46_9BURK|nr:hypothetical protein [Rhodoferax sp. TBRC 17660]MDT7520644.1 hypothetical protein [Rhodoferax sp. TBRC 17660]
MKRDIWGVFHDGVLKYIDDSVPGTLMLEVEIEYLRGMFDEPGTSFRIELTGHTKVVYSEYDEEPSQDITKIQERMPEILYVTSEQPLLLDCVMGTLELEYDAMRVMLPSEVEVSYESLVSASDRYWSEWSVRSKGDAQPFNREDK